MGFLYNKKNWLVVCGIILISISLVKGFKNYQVYQATQAILALPTATPLPPTMVRFAVIGDYGTGNRAERHVANLVKHWNPAFIITVGDNNYEDGEASTIDHHIGQFYHEFIHPYQGEYGKGAVENRFFPTLGNHDWHTLEAQPYFDYFTLPSNERYYDFTWGVVHLFALNSNKQELDGISSDSKQAQWLKEKLALSPAPWKIVYLHHPPYSSGPHGPQKRLQWPYQAWGATAVLAGHDHTYERIIKNGFPYFVNGLGGRVIYEFIQVEPDSQVRYNQDYGAMLIEASKTAITFRFITRQGKEVDVYTKYK